MPQNSTKKKILISTGGGDCPGLNAVIRAATKRAILGYGWEVWGVQDALNGLLVDEGAKLGLVRLDLEMVSGLLIKGGTILGTTNKGGPFTYPKKQSDGSVIHEDRSELLVRRFKEFGFDYLISIGGDGSQTIALELIKKGIKVVGVPKTIDNDLSATDYTFGFQTAIDIATDAIDRLRTTGESHDRVMILEVMGRDAGWIALHAGITGGVDLILIPEIPYKLPAIAETLKSRIARGHMCSIIVVAEGAKEDGGSVIGEKVTYGDKTKIHLGGIGDHVGKQISEALNIDTRVTVLGHLQRGGTPSAFDRLLATQFGAQAVDLVAQDKSGYMVALRNLDIVAVPIEEAVKNYNHVNADGQLVQIARGIGIGFGDIAVDSFINC